MTVLRPDFTRNRQNWRYVSGALLAGLLALTACQERLLLEEKTPFGDGGVRMGDTAVAEIDGTKIYLSDVERAASAQGLIVAGSPLTPENPVFQQVLNEKIDQRLLALEALKQALDQEDETRRRLNDARERILSHIIIEKHLATQVTEETIGRMYAEQASLAYRGPERRARQIVVETNEDILAIIERLDAGENFSVLAQELSIDLDTKSKGGDLGFFSQDMLDPNLTNLVFETEIGALTAPVKTDFGWHVLKVEDRRNTEPKSFEEMREELKKFMTFEEIQELVRSLRSRGEVKFLYGKGVETPTAQGVETGSVSGVNQTEGSDRDKQDPKSGTKPDVAPKAQDIDE